MIDMNSNKTCANRTRAGIVIFVMTAVWVLIPLALLVVAPLVGLRDLHYRDKRGSWRNYR
jgi:uncharacterized membrane protein YhaH (DUF805 family)